MATRRSLAFHHALRTDLPIAPKLSDRVSNKLDDIFVAHFVPALIRSIDVECAAPVRNQLLLTIACGLKCSCQHRYPIRFPRSLGGLTQVPPPAMFVAICWQSVIKGDPSLVLFSNVESPQSLIALRASMDATAPEVRGAQLTEPSRAAASTTPKERSMMDYGELVQ